MERGKETNQMVVKIQCLVLSIFINGQLCGRTLGKERERGG